MGEVQESVTSLNQFLANLIDHQNRSLEGPLPVLHDEGRSRKPVRAAQFE